MKKVKSVKKWGIYELNAKERQEYDFTHAVIDPETMECYSSCLEPSDTDWECNSLEEAINWVINY